jgi:hypothetical protein
MVLHIHAAIDIENLAGDIAGVVGGQKLYGVGYIGHLYQPRQWNPGSQLFAGLGGQCLRHCRFDESRCNCIDSNITRLEA